MNITEFSKIAQVSKSAVSRYFNNGYLSQDKREKIEEAIRTTGYCPSIQAQTIRTRKTKLVGVIIPKLSSESCAKVTEGISEILSEEGYQILLANTANDPEKEIEYLDLFRQNRVDGVIFLATVFSQAHHTLLRKMRIPVIIVGQQYKGYNCVCHDDYGAAHALTTLMISKGSSNPAFLGVTNEDISAGLSRKEGFIQAVKDAGIAIGASNIGLSDFTMESGYVQTKRMLSTALRPDCLLCATDNIALGAMQYCREKHISIPGDIMIAAFGDNKIDRVTEVSLTSAHLHYTTSGRDAAQMLLLNLRTNETVPKILKLDYEIIERQSTQK
ncbi:MAG: LacI family DNA-binding transcriptional regulator [Oscillospiraceae bacterium]|nr:LacI family DNA-binding transcriptional regulator [Oscillospiraceae bacterium]